MIESPILNDYVFKQVFGQKDDDPILISFLNAMLNGDVNIKHVKIINSELPRFSELGRTILLDVQVQTEDGAYIDIEVQNGYRDDLVDRMFVYGANMVTRYSEKATLFNSVKCIAIWILNCNMPVFNKFGNETIIGEFNFRSLQSPDKYLPIEGLKIYPIELNKGTSVLDLSPVKQTWINFLKSSSENISNPIEIEEIHEAYKKVLYTIRDNKYKSYIEAIKRTEQLYAGNVVCAKEEGLKEGEYTAKKETAKNLVVMGLSVEQISRATGLSIEEVKLLM